MNFADIHGYKNDYNYNKRWDGDGVSATEAQKRAIARWQKERVEEIKFRVPKGKKTVIQEHATQCGESVNAFLNRAVEETMFRDAQNKTED